MNIQDFNSRLVAAENGCLLWPGSKNNTGYGTVSIDGKIYVAHRVAAFLAGMIDSLDAPRFKSEPGFVLHKCDVRACCNPEHLFIGNYSENQKDAYAKGRRKSFKGVEHTNAKLSLLQVEEIRNKYKSDSVTYKQVNLAKEYGVSQRCISLIVRGETYK